MWQSVEIMSENEIEQEDLRRKETNSEPQTNQDFADLLDEELTDEQKVNNPAYANPQNAAQKVDRAVILGHDGKWAAAWALRFILVVIAAVIAWRGLAIIWSAVLPIFLALLIATVLWPPVRWMRSKNVPSALATLITIIGFFAIIAGVFTAIAPMVTAQSKDLIVKAEEGVSRLIEWAQGEPLNLDTSQFEGMVGEITNFLQGRSSDIASGVFTGVSAASSILITLVLALVLTFFFLKDGTKFLPTIRSAAGPNVGWHLSEALTRVWNTLAGFIRTQAIVSLVDAVFIGIGLLVLNVPLALALAVITFFAGFIPIVGAFTAGALAVVIALVSNGVTNALLVLALIILVQQIEGNVLQPILQSNAMNLHPAIVLLSVALGSTLFGVVGAFLAVPVAATIAVLIRYHLELVALRAGEITIDDIEMATTAESSTAKDPMETWHGFVGRLNQLAKRKPIKPLGHPKSEKATAPNKE